jgi:N-acetylmuramoyl-L-alanine amidase
VLVTLALVVSLRSAATAPSRALADDPTPTPGDGAGPSRGQTEPDFTTPTPTATPVPTPEGVPGTRRTNRRPVVVLDPGHGGEEVGAADNGIVEKDSNLEMAARVQRLLQERGITVVLTRYQDSRAAGPGGIGWTAEYLDRQGRIDIANAARGDLLVSIHSNGSVNHSFKGVEAWYDPTTYYGGNSQRLALLLKDQVIDELDQAGYSATDRGLQDSSCFQLVDGYCASIMVISQLTVMFRDDVERQGGDPEAAGFKGASLAYTRALAMPSSLIELLFITNPSDAAMLSRESGREAMARGVANGILKYLGEPLDDGP